MNTLRLATRRVRTNMKVLEAMSQCEPATFPAHALQAVLVWQEGHRRRNCAARLLNAGHGEITLIIFGSPAQGTRVLLHFVDPPWYGSARVANLVPGVSADGPHQARMKLGREGWNEWKTSFLTWDRQKWLPVSISSVCANA